MEFGKSAPRWRGMDSEPSREISEGRDDFTVEADQEGQYAADGKVLVSYQAGQVPGREELRDLAVCGGEASFGRADE